MKIYLFLLIPCLLFAQAKEKDWSDKTINFPTAKDDSTSLMYADPGEKITSDQYNKLLRAIRVIEDKLGIGSSTPGTPGQILKTQGDGFSTAWGFNATDADSLVWREDISDSLNNIYVQMDDSSGVVYIDSSCTKESLQLLFDGLDNLNTKIVFKRGTYNFSGNIIARHVKNLIIEGNGALININGDPSNDGIGFYSNDGTSYSLTSPFQASWFTTNLLQDSNWVGITNPDNFTTFNLEKGDMVILTDSNYASQVPGTRVYNGDILYFHHLDTLSGPTYRMYFEHPAIYTVLCKDSLYWSQAENISNRSVSVNNLKIKNGGIYFYGLEKISISDCEITTDVDTENVLTYHAAISNAFCRYIFVNNVLTKNQHRIGMGYGINPCDFEICSINNFTSINCKHGISTGNSNYCSLNKILMVNNYYYSAPKGMEWISRGVNNHTGTFQEYYNNCYVENAHTGIDARAQNTIVSNYTAKNTMNALRICGTSLYNRKGFADVNGLWAYNSGVAINIDDANNTIIKLNNINLYASKDYAGTLNGRLIFFNGPDFNNRWIADSIFLSNSTYKFEGTLGTGYIPLSLSSWSSVDSFYCNYLKVDNCNFNGFYYFLSNARLSVKNIDITNCDLGNFNYLFYNQYVDTTATNKIFGRLEFNNCKIKNNAPVYLWNNNWTRFKNITFRDCDLYDTSPGILRYIYSDTVSFIDNKFYRTSVRSTFSTNGNSNIIKNLRIMGNRISGNPQSTDIFDIDADVSNTFIIGNYLDCNTKRLMQLANTHIQIINNIFMPDSCFGPISGTRFYTNGGVIGSIIGNTFLYDKDDDTYVYGFKFNAAGDSLYIADNNFILGTNAKKHASQRLFDVETGAKIRLGINVIEGWYQTWFTGSGTVNKAPILWENFRIDSLSTTNRTDTLSLYMGATEYVIPKK
jgi:hypothetical protein